VQGLSRMTRGKGLITEQGWPRVEMTMGMGEKIPIDNYSWSFAAEAVRRSE